MHIHEHITQIVARTRHGAYKRNAKYRGYEFALTHDQFIDLIQRPCTYCGCKPNTVSHFRGINGQCRYNGIDRIDNNMGYIIDNCETCCVICNKAKRVMAKSDFINWIDTVYNHLHKSTL